MIDYSGLIEEYERRAQQAEQFTRGRTPTGVVSLEQAIRAETKAATYRRVANDLRDEARRQREVRITTTAPDGTRTRYDVEHRADGRVSIHEREWTGTHYRGVGVSELFESLEIELGAAVNRFGGREVPR